MMSGVSVGDTDYDLLVQYFLEDNGLIEPAVERPILGFASDVHMQDQDMQPVTLRAVSNLQYVNALVPGQTLTFCPKLTAIYGANGSGKSGYARVLGSAGFTRGDDEVLPDVTSSADGVPSADIEIYDGLQSKTICHTYGVPCQELASFYVFDSTSVRVHVTKSNEVSFSPTGLCVLTDLASIIDKVKDKLQARIDECKRPHTFNQLFQGDSIVSEIVNNLGPKTDLKELRKLATLTEKESLRIEELDLTIAKLKSQDIQKQISELDKQISDLEGLVSQLKSIKANLGDEVFIAVKQAVNAYLTAESAIKQTSVDQFKSVHFSQTGSDLWQAFTEAAKALADSESNHDQPYPQTGSHCLLCHQPLSEEASELLFRLWSYLESEAQAKLVEAQDVLDVHINTFNELDLEFFNEQTVCYRHLQECDGALIISVTKFIEGYGKRRATGLDALSTKKPASKLSSISDAPISAVEQIVLALKEHTAELGKQDPTEELKKLEQELQELKHRELLKKHLPEIEAYVNQRIWASRASKISCTTTNITRKHKEMFNKLVTDQYINLFEKTLDDLKRPLRVKVKSQGKKGKLFKELCLMTDSVTIVEKAELDKVLSEGEQRAIAIADFLTEVALDTNSSGIILDDPVTSLDVDWKETIARRLVEESGIRQVIVFTHDLHFLYLIKKFAEDKDVEMATHWVKRGDHDDRPGYVYLNNSPALERDYRKPRKARECLECAVTLAPEEQELVLRQGFAALRTNYEAFIVFDLFNEVVRRFEEPISFGRLKDVVIDNDIVETVINKCELLSRYLEGHLHSDNYSAQKPTLKSLESEIKAFEDLKNKHKALCKSCGKS